jgi:hypothetical protein
MRQSKPKLTARLEWMTFQTTITPKRGKITYLPEAALAGQFERPGPGKKESPRKGRLFSL